MIGPKPETSSEYVMRVMRGAAAERVAWMLRARPVEVISYKDTKSFAVIFKGPRSSRLYEGLRGLDVRDLVNAAYGTGTFYIHERFYERLSSFPEVQELVRAVRATLDIGEVMGS